MRHSVFAGEIGVFARVTRARLVIVFLVTRCELTVLSLLTLICVSLTAAHFGRILSFPDSFTLCMRSLTKHLSYFATICFAHKGFECAC